MSRRLALVGLPSFVVLSLPDLGLARVEWTTDVPGEPVRG